MQITREVDYAVRCVLHLARDPGRVAAATEIAAAVRIPRSFLAKILQKLTREGVVTSVRGVQGGFALARSPREVTLLDVVEAVQGPLALNRCVAAGEHCVLQGSCAVHPVWRRLTARLAGELKKQSFARLAQEQQRRVPCTEEGGHVRVRLR